MYAVQYDGRVRRWLVTEIADLDLASIGAAGSLEATVPVPGARPGDLVVATIHGRLNAADSPTTNTASVNARVSAADVVTLHFVNNSSVAIDPQNNLTGTVAVLTSVP